MAVIRLIQFTDYNYGNAPSKKMLHLTDEDIELEFEEQFEDDEGEEYTDIITRQGFKLLAPNLMRYRVAEEEAVYKKLTIRIGE